MMIENKKGAVHIDWVISITIFLTYIILLITFIKPSYEPAFEGDVLVGLIKKSFHDEVSWNVSKALLSFRCDTKGVADINLADYIFDVSSSVKVLLQEKDEQGNNRIADYKDTLLVILPNNNYDFWVLYNFEEGYSDFETSELEDDGPEDPKNCEISAANPIVFKGINKNKLANLDVDKISENFPEFRQFKIRVMDSDGNLLPTEGPLKYCFVRGLEGRQSKADCDNAGAPADATVYGVNLGDVILDRNLNRDQVILNIQVW